MSHIRTWTKQRYNNKVQIIKIKYGCCFLSSGSREVMAKLLIINVHVYMPMRHTSVLDMLYLVSITYVLDMLYLVSITSVFDML